MRGKEELVVTVRNEPAARATPCVSPADSFARRDSGGGGGRQEITTELPRNARSLMLSGRTQVGGRNTHTHTHTHTHAHTPKKKLFAFHVYSNFLRYTCLLTHSLTHSLTP